MKKLHIALTSLLLCLLLASCTAQPPAAVLSEPLVSNPAEPTAEGSAPEGAPTEALSGPGEPSDPALPSSNPAPGGPSSAGSGPAPHTAGVSSLPVPPSESPSEPIVIPLPDLTLPRTSKPPVYFSPPAEQAIYDHRSTSLSSLIQWINSDGALTEEEGAYRKAVEFHRLKNEILVPRFTDQQYEIDMVYFYSDGPISYKLKNRKGIVGVHPIVESEEEALANGIQQYFSNKYPMNQLIPTTYPGGYELYSTYSAAQYEINGKMTEAVHAQVELRSTIMNGSVVSTSYKNYIYFIYDNQRIIYEDSETQPTEPNIHLLQNLYFDSVPLTNESSSLPSASLPS